VSVLSFLDSESDSSEEESSMEESDDYDYIMSENGLFTMYGQCEVVGDCVSSRNYPGSYGNHEMCDISVHRGASVRVTSLSLETCCDHLYINGMDTEYAAAVPTTLYGGSYIRFTTDYSVTRGGFQLCFSDPGNWKTCKEEYINIREIFELDVQSKF